MKLLLTTILLSLVALPSVASGADDKSKGKELIDRARKLCDIRAADATAFRLDGTFEISSKNGSEKTKGTVSETWLSSRLWRREVQTNDFHHIEIRNNAARWVADSGTNRPEPALYAPLTLLFESGVPDLAVSGISERVVNARNATCVESGTGWTKKTECMDSESGVFLQRDVSFDAFSGGLGAVRHSCFYGKYARFGDKFFPQVVTCTNDPGGDIELTVTKLAAEAPTDPSLFVRPLGAIETSVCEKRTPPTPISHPDPQLPARFRSETATVTVSTLVGEDGVPRDLQVVGSAGPDFDKAALNAVRQWRFKPSTCDGAPVQARTAIEVAFKVLRRQY